MNLLPYNLQLQLQNPDATAPLIVPVHVVLNIPESMIRANIEANSRLEKEWVKMVPEHDGTALIVGGGPSVADCMDDICERWENGAEVFALNGAAKYLNRHGVFPDYQVILDARERTSELVGPADAHLFASQVDPKLFAMKPDARLWHLQIENIEDHFPDYQRPYALVGGGASVGVSAVCLAYVLGFRKMRLYGYDSCHREGKGHVYPQQMNNSDPVCNVDFGSKTYLASLTMKMQAERFQVVGRALQQAGCKIEVLGDGLLPDMWRKPVAEMSDAEKYSLMWGFEDYRVYSPGEGCSDEFLQVADPSGVVIDFGCGTGRAAVKFAEAGLDPMLVDFTINSRDDKAMGLPFLQWDLRKPLPVSAEYGFCTDVLEHIATDDVDEVLDNIMASARNVFFQISTVQDAMGGLIGEPLHLTILSFDEWRDILCQYGEIAYARRGGETATFYVKGQRNDH